MRVILPLVSINKWQNHHPRLTKSRLQEPDKIEMGKHGKNQISNKKNDHQNWFTHKKVLFTDLLKSVKNSLK